MIPGIELKNCLILAKGCQIPKTPKKLLILYMLTKWVNKDPVIWTTLIRRHLHLMGQKLGQKFMNIPFKRQRRKKLLQISIRIVSQIALIRCFACFQLQNPVYLDRLLCLSLCRQCISRVSSQSAYRFYIYPYMGMKVQLPALPSSKLWRTNKSTNQSTEQQTDMRGHRLVKTFNKTSRPYWIKQRSNCEQRVLKAFEEPLPGRSGHKEGVPCREHSRHHVLLWK